MKEYVQELTNLIGTKSLLSLKKELAKKYKLKKIPTNIQIINNLNKEQRTKFSKYFVSKPTRTLSGVAPIAIMTSPEKCPHGKCIMCPGGPDSFFGNIPQSYTGKEPATMRGLRSDFDPFLQVFSRLEQYLVLGQNPEKAELIIMGGTFPARTKEYQKQFITEAFQALNLFSKLFYKTKFNSEKFNKFFELPGSVDDKVRVASVKKKILKLKTKTTLEKEHKINETSKIKCVGLTVETRPDQASEEQLKYLLSLGVTRLEIGVQTLSNSVLKAIERGHTVEDTIKATKIAKDLAFKINYHMMIGLSSEEQDLKTFKLLFEDPNFRPDMLKIYPCLVMKGTKLFDLYKKNKYHPLTTEKAISLLNKIKQFIPEYCRVMRVQRDIPTKFTEAGPDITNLRQYLNKCKCIRCREPKDNFIPKNPKLIIREYEASKGKEFFISLEENNFILGFCRLRILKDKALIRELHVYGNLTKLKEEGAIQHKGYGKLLIKKAEELSKNKPILIISAIGTRGYYRKLGYKLKAPYMIKFL